MRMRVFIALLCCLMLSGCQHSASLPAADKVETEDMAEWDTEKPADGKIIDFDGDGIEDAAALSIVDKDYAKLTVTRGRGKTLEEEIPGWWWFVDHETGRDSLEPTDVPVCDFDGDGKDEMLIQLAFAGSSGPSREIHIFKVENDNLEAVLAASHSKMFFSKDTSEHSKLGELMTFGNGKSRPKTDGPIPVYGGNGVLSYTDHHNIENAVLIGRVGAYCGSVYLEQGICWVSDNAIFAKSKITKDEFFDYFLLKRLNLFNHHVGTGQQLLTQEILNNIEVPKPVTEQIELFNRKATSIFETIFTNSREIIRLQELSDLLLSRLAG